MQVALLRVREWVLGCWPNNGRPLSRLQRLPDELLTLIGGNLDMNDFVNFARSLDLERTGGRVDCNTIDPLDMGVSVIRFRVSQNNGPPFERLLLKDDPCEVLENLPRNEFRRQIRWRYSHFYGFEGLANPPSWLDLTDLRRVEVSLIHREYAQSPILPKELFSGVQELRLIADYGSFDWSADYGSIDGCPVWKLALPRLQTLRLTLFKTLRNEAEVLRFVGQHPRLTTLELDIDTNGDAPCGDATDVLITMAAELLALPEIHRMQVVNFRIQDPRGLQRDFYEFTTTLARWRLEKSGPSICRFGSTCRPSAIPNQCFHVHDGMRTSEESFESLEAAFRRDADSDGDEPMPFGLRPDPPPRNAGEFFSNPRSLLPLEEICPVLYEAFEYLVLGEFAGNAHQVANHFPDRQIIRFVNIYSKHIPDLPDLLPRRTEGREAIVSLHIKGGPTILSLGVDPPTDLSFLSDCVYRLSRRTEMERVLVGVLDLNRRVIHPGDLPKIGRRLVDLPRFDPSLRRRRWLWGNRPTPWVIPPSSPTPWVSFDAAACRRDLQGFKKDLQFIESCGEDTQRRSSWRLLN